MFKRVCLCVLNVSVYEHKRCAVEGFVDTFMGLCVFSYVHACVRGGERVCLFLPGNAILLTSRQFTNGHRKSARSCWMC